jgi:dolichol kinase
VHPHNVSERKLFFFLFSETFLFLLLSAIIPPRPPIKGACIEALEWGEGWAALIKKSIIKSYATLKIIHKMLKKK